MAPLSRTWHDDIDGGSRIPLEPHRVAQHLLGLSVRVTQVPSVESAVAVQRVDVLRQSQQSAAVVVLHFQLQQVAAALQAVHALLHVDHAHQREPAAGAPCHVVYKPDITADIRSGENVHVLFLLDHRFVVQMQMIHIVSKGFQLDVTINDF